MRSIRPLLPAALAMILAAGPVALSGGAPAAAVTGPAVASGDTTYAYTAQLLIGDQERGCSGALVDREWLLTAASCFADDPAASLTIPAGKPLKKTTATIGRSDLTGSAGSVREVVELVPRDDRDAVLARLNRPVTDIAPLAVDGTAPVAGEELRLAGYGRTRTEWAPLALHTGAFSVDGSTATTATVTGEDDVAACMGDTGGPLVRTSGGTPRLAALASRSYQGGCFGISADETRTGGIVTRVDDLAGWVDSTAGAVRITDYNCDGAEDIAVADPQATVGGDAEAGLVRVVYGGGTGTAEITQDLDWVPGGSEPGDSFGESLATVDYNEDGCTDLIVGSPGEDLGGEADAGFVQILYGAPGGLGTGTLKATHLEQGMGAGGIGASSSKAGDRMGDSLAAAITAAGEPFVVIGVPGKSVGAFAHAGIVFYLRGSTTNIAVHQNNSAVPGAAEANDRFGESVAADANHLAIGSPGEAIGTKAEAGAVVVFNHTLNAEGRPTAQFGLDQDLDTVSDGAEAGDRFGEAVALAPYRPFDAESATESILSVGSPGEDLTVDGAGKADTGMVHTFRITAAGTYTQLNGFSQGTSDDEVAGTAEAGDRFGATLSAVNTAPRAVSTTATMKLAIGIPEKTVGTAAKAGAILTLPPLDAPGANDRWLEAGDSAGIPGTPGTNQYLGTSLHFTGSRLYVGMPYGPSPYGALHALPLPNVTADGTPAPVTTYQPGQNGLPPTGTHFGLAAR